MFWTPMAHSQKIQAFTRPQIKPWWIPKTQNKTKQQEKMLHDWLWFFYHTAVKLETNNKIIAKIRYKFLKIITGVREKTQTISGWMTVKTQSREMTHAINLVFVTDKNNSEYTKEKNLKLDFQLWNALNLYFFILNSFFNVPFLFLFFYLFNIFIGCVSFCCITKWLSYTMVCYFLLYNRVTQLYLHMHPNISSPLHLPPTLPIPPF